MKIKRLEQLEGYIREKKLCAYEELCGHFDISVSTVHRDVNELVKQGTVEKVHGGVAWKKELPAQEDSSFLNYEYGKDRIAERAAALVDDNDIILLGSGSTVAHMVHHLKGRKNITVITNNFIVIAEAMKYGFNVITVGGNLDRNVMCFVGTQSIKQLGELNANKAFIGCNGITRNGITNVVDLEADIKKTMIRISSQTFVLAESRKFGEMSLYTICSLDEIDRLITDEEPPKQFQKLLKEHKVVLETAD